MGSYLYQLYRGFQGEILAVPGRVIALIFVILLFLLPLIIPHPMVLKIFSLAAIFAIFAASWDFLSGFTGQLNLGQALFFGVSAYSAALLNIHLGVPPWATIPIGAIAGVIAGLLVGIPALRLRGFYLALVTLAFPIILIGVIYVFPDITGGELGLFGVDRLSGSRVLDYYIILLVATASILVMWKLTDGRSKIVRTGVILHAIREDEITARASGINTVRYKLMVFSISGFFAGVAGGLYAHYIRIAGPSILELFFSFQPIIWTIFGGIVTIYGAVAGVFILYPLVELVRLHPVGEIYRIVLMVLILIVVLLFMPQGITRWVRDHIEEICPRCKLINIRTRRYCRACRAPLHAEK
ncbi:branched-chain amino acid ABC transporter permease [Dehalococcoidia bacterium]|nr:branched-chain amino acid ABC transporter permease [Dehalococcoidia bacterium]